MRMIKGIAEVPGQMLWTRLAGAVTAGHAVGLGGKRAGPAESPSQPLPRQEAGRRQGGLSQSRKTQAGEFPDHTLYPQKHAQSNGQASSLKAVSHEGTLCYRQHRSRDAPVPAGARTRPDIREPRTKRSRSREPWHDSIKPDPDTDIAQENVRRPSPTSMSSCPDLMPSKHWILFSF